MNDEFFELLNWLMENYEDVLNEWTDSRREEE